MTLRNLIFCSASSTLLLAPAHLPAADDVIQKTSASSVAGPVIPAEAVRSPAESIFQKPFVSLISEDGLNGWQIHEGKASAWRREGDVISCLASTGGWLRSDQVYSDFVLRLEYRIQAGGNTGIGLRAPAAGNPTFTGLEIQLLDDSAPKYADLRPDQYTGSVYYQAAATQKAPLNPVNEWNQCEIRCLGDEVIVQINGAVVNHVHLNKMQQPASQSPHLLTQRPPLGHIALQSHSSRVDFRKIEIQDLTSVTPTGLRYSDLVQGNGEQVGDAKFATIHYVGQLSTGKRFTDTRSLGEAVQIPLEDVIPGLQEGIRTMAVNGRRRLVVPPHLGYGNEGAGDTIPPHATLVFEIEVTGVTR